MLIKKHEIGFGTSDNPVEHFKKEFNEQMSDAAYVNDWVRDGKVNPQWWFWTNGWNSSEQNDEIEKMVKDSGYSKAEFKNVEDRTKNTLIKVFF